jgi:general secretion pathway protein F
MRTFAYRAFSDRGQQQKGEIDAGDEAEATRLLRNKGLKVAHIALRNDSPTRDKRTSLLFSSIAKPSHERLFSELAILMNAGLRFDQALLAISSDTSNRANQQLASDLLEHISAGRSPSAAFQHAKGLRADVVALVSSGEHSGRLPHVFSVLASELEKQGAQRKAFIDASIYPLFLLFMMFCALLVVTFVLVPALEPIFEGAGKPAPMMIGLFSAVGNTLTAPGSLLFLGLFVATAMVLAIVKRGALRELSSRLLSNLPLVGTVVRKAGLARYLQSLAILLENGVATPTALLLAAQSCPVSAFHRPLLSVRDHVTSGERLPDTLSRIALFPPGIVSLVAVGDEVNNLPVVLAKAANTLQGESQRLLDRMLAMLTPLITIVLGVLIGGLVISVMLALLSINELSVQ